MNKTFELIHSLVDEIIEDYAKNPIDLLGINDHEGEEKYLKDLRDSYIRTIMDIVTIKPISYGENNQIKILEIGAFLGVVSVCLAKMGYLVSTVDIPEFISNQKLQSVFRDNDIEYFPCNLRNYSLQFLDSSFDCVIMCEVIEHLNFNPLPILQEINRILVTGGLFYLSLPNIASLKNRIKLLSGKSIHNPIKDYFRQLSKSENMIIGLHWREYNLSEIKEMLEALGFKVEKQIYFSNLDSKAVYSLKFLILKATYFCFRDLKENQTTFALKASNSSHDFYFTEATSSI